MARRLGSASARKTVSWRCTENYISVYLWNVKLRSDPGGLNPTALHARHEEFGAPAAAQSIERGVFAKAVWGF